MTLTLSRKYQVPPKHSQAKRKVSPKVQLCVRGMPLPVGKCKEEKRLHMRVCEG